MHPRGSGGSRAIHRRSPHSSITALAGSQRYFTPSDCQRTRACRNCRKGADLSSCGICPNTIRIEGVDTALAHLNQFTGFGPSAPVLILVLSVNLAITTIHSYQELKGIGAPIWRNFGAIVGVDVPNLLGFLLFTAALTLALWAAGFIGIAAWLPLAGFVTPALAAAALGLLIGARLSDTLVSHVLPYGVGYRPNPGLASTPLYILEALFIAFAFHPGLAAYPKSGAVGLALGVLFFLAVLPSLWLLRLAAPPWKRSRWLRWQPAPEWASITLANREV